LLGDGTESNRYIGNTIAFEMIVYTVEVNPSCGKARTRKDQTSRCVVLNDMDKERRTLLHCIKMNQRGANPPCSPHGITSKGKVPLLRCVEKNQGGVVNPSLCHVEIQARASPPRCIVSKETRRRGLPPNEIWRGDTTSSSWWARL
jgi:hypothetical protein